MTMRKNMTPERKKYNAKCIEILKTILETYPDMRIEQALFCLDAELIVNGDDRFYEEPNVTVERWTTWSTNNLIKK